MTVPLRDPFERVADDNRVAAGLRVVAVVGPTAVGKSALGVALARASGGVVVNADAMQVYRGMDIGTAKVTAAERAGVPHLLLDVCEVTEEMSVADFQQRARAEIEACLQRGQPPVLVGGSGLYVSGVLDDLRFPGTDPEIRARLEAELAHQGPAALHARLGEVDPDAAALILATNGRRIVRALEVVELTGAPFAAALPDPTPVYNDVRIGLTLARAELDERIARRVDAMWAQGLVGEVRELQALGLEQGRTAPRALGYAQVLAFLAGELTEQQAREATVAATRRFARRQEKWFRRDARVHWLPADAADLLPRALALVEAPPG